MLLGVLSFPKPGLSESSFTDLPPVPASFPLLKMFRMLLFDEIAGLLDDPVHDQERDEMIAMGWGSTGYDQGHRRRASDDRSSDLPNLRQQSQGP
jgi:hypothetical protein